MDGEKLVFRFEEDTTKMIFTAFIALFLSIGVNAANLRTEASATL